jgi:hypothetical protein
MCLIRLAIKGIVHVTALDALAVALSVGTLVYFFVLGPRGAGVEGWTAALGILSRPALDSALLFLSLVTLSLVHRPPFTNYLALGFAVFLIADTSYLVGIQESPYELGSWPELIYALGLLILGSGALRAVPADFTPRQRINPWKVLSFWFGPFSPPLHFGFLLMWGVFNPPLPAYVYAGAAGVLLYLAARVGLISFATRKLSREQEDLTRRWSRDVSCASCTIP